MNLLEVIRRYQELCRERNSIYAYHHMVQDCGVNPEIMEEIRVCFDDDNNPIDGLGYQTNFQFSR